MNDIAEKHDIIKSIGVESALEQLAEESAELTHAALKLSRALRGVNPTPISTTDAVLALHEEVNDVLLCVSVLESALVSLRSDSIMSNKLIRWEQRLNEIHGGGAVMQSVGGTNDDT